MKLFNKGTSTIIHAESHISGSACDPQKVFSVSDELGKKLRGMYPKQLESLEDATEKFAEPVVEKGTKKKKESDVSKAEEAVDATQDEIAEAKTLSVSVSELRKLKE